MTHIYIGWKSFIHNNGLIERHLIVNFILHWHFLDKVLYCVNTVISSSLKSPFGKKRHLLPTRRSPFTCWQKRYELIEWNFSEKWICLTSQITRPDAFGYVFLGHSYCMVYWTKSTTIAELLGSIRADVANTPPRCKTSNLLKDRTCNWRVSIRTLRYYIFLFGYFHSTQKIMRNSAL